MSSPQSIDSEKSAKQLERFFQDSSNAKRDAAYEDADGKRKHAAEAKDGRFSTTDAEAQLGRPLTAKQIKTRLLMLNPNLQFEQSIRYPDHMGIYIRDGVSNMTDPDLNCRGRRHLCGMMFGISPEFTVRKTEVAEGGMRFVSEVRGWRTVLRRLIGAGVISLAATENVFEIVRGRESEAWFRSLE